MSLNIKVYINILLVILIVSIVLNNVGIKLEFGTSPFNVKQSNYPVGSLMEQFDSGSDSGNDAGSREELERYADELAGLNGTEDTTVAKRGLSRKSALIAEERKVERTAKEENVPEVKESFENFAGNFPQMPVKPGNFFGLADNSANFGSNVMDINKFYSNNFGDMEFRTPYTGNAGARQLSAKQMLDGGAPSVDTKTGNGTATYKPDMWQYKSEVVMNGGDLFNGVSGYDGMADDGLALFNSGTPVVGAACSGGDMSAASLDNDDLRMGLGVPGREQRFT